jgi:hypothetical protein
MKCQGEIFGHSLFVDARVRRFSRQELQGLNGVFSLCPGEAGTAALRALIRRVTLTIIMVNENDCTRIPRSLLRGMRA